MFKGVLDRRLDCPMCGGKGRAADSQSILRKHA